MGLTLCPLENHMVLLGVGVFGIKLHHAGWVFMNGISGFIKELPEIALFLPGEEVVRWTFSEKASEKKVSSQTLISQVSFRKWETKCLLFPSYSVGSFFVTTAQMGTISSSTTTKMKCLIPKGQSCMGCGNTLHFYWLEVWLT